MIEHDCPPDAQLLLESLRSVGYSLESALADLIDNSLSAHSTSISIEFRAADDLYVAVVDDGDGMDSAQLDAAMRHGSRHPQELRDEADLGRFGLGLKTASLSQCRRMTVVSFSGGHLSGRCWDLDVVARTRRWTLLSLDDDEIALVPHVDQLRKQGKGTIVHWAVLDRLLAGESDPRHSLGQKIDACRDHLATVFHRFIDGERRGQAVKIQINGAELDAIDPFLRHHTATQFLEEDSFNVEGRRVTVKPYILPHRSKLSAEDARKAGGADGLRSQQGFYIYRNRRLIIWGTWFRLARKDELSKLARVRVDIPNTLDHLWTLDIKKAVAFPPEAVRRSLQRTVLRISERSRQAYVFRGRRAPAAGMHHAWTRVTTRKGVHYQVNRDHPVIREFTATLPLAGQAFLDAVIDMLEQSFPADAMYADIASEVQVAPDADDEEARMRQYVSSIAAALRNSPAQLEAFARSLPILEPYSRKPELARRLGEELLNGK